MSLRKELMGRKDLYWKSLQEIVLSREIVEGSIEILEKRSGKPNQSVI